MLGVSPAQGVSPVLARLLLLLSLLKRVILPVVTVLFQTVMLLLAQTSISLGSSVGLELLPVTAK